ncbi:MAG: hypothetical protein EHM24_27830, partial [Acidobacteria bacterium]
MQMQNAGARLTRRKLLRACTALVPLPFLPVRVAARAAAPPRTRQLDVRLQPAGRPQAGGGPETLRSVAAVPPEIAGAFRDPVAFAQAASGQYFVLDDAAHTVYGIDAAFTGAWKLVSVGGEAGRILQPTGFGLAPNGTFVVADRPGERERIQVFGSGGALLGGFTLPGRADAVVTIGGLTLNGAGSLHYTGRTILLSLPETGAL